MHEYVRECLCPESLFLALALMVCLVAIPGADFRQYKRWAQTMASADIEMLAVPGRSPLGVPFFQWSAGPGMPFAIAYRLLPEEAADGVFLAGGALFAMAFWLTMHQALALLTSPKLAMLGVGLGFIATPLGYASVAISSETLSLFPAGVLFLQTVRGAKGLPMSLGAVAASTALLILFRSYLAAYAWPAMWLCATACPINAVACLRRLSVMAASIALGAWPVLTTNYWMTGTPWRSPYKFGDASFQSLDPSSPHIWHVLFDTFHGLFPTHPLAFLGIFAAMGLVKAVQQNLHYRVQLAWILGIAAIGVNTWAQGCWYYWWLATHFSLGTRGLTLAAIQGVCAIVLLWHAVDSKTRSRQELPTQAGSQGPLFLWGLGLLLCTLVIWSFLLLSQGPMDYLTWGKMTLGQGVETKYWTQPVLLPLWFFSVAICRLSLWPRLKGASLPLKLLATLCAVLVLVYVIDRLQAYLLSPFLGYAALAVWGLLWRYRKLLRLQACADLLLLHGSPCCLALMLISFFPLWQQTKLPRAIPADGYVATYQPLEPVQALGILVEIPRFSDQAERLRGFLERNPEHAGSHPIALPKAGDPPMFLLESEPRSDAWMDRRSRERLKHR